MLGALCSFLSSFTWAVGSTGYGKLSRDHSPFAVNFTRGLVALPLFVIAALWAAGGPAELGAQVAAFETWRVFWLVASMVASYGVGDALFMWSTRSLGVPAALAICSCYPVWTTLVGAIFLGQPVDGWRALGVVVTVAGVVTVILAGTSGRWPRRGIALAVISSMFWALNSVSISIGASGDVSPFLANAIRMVFALVIAGAIGRAVTPRAPVALPWVTLRPVLWIFVFEVFFGSAFFLYGLTHAPLAVAAVLSSLAPVLSVPIAWLVTRERPTARKTLGICLTVAGIALLAF